MRRTGRLCRRFNGGHVIVLDPLATSTSHGGGSSSPHGRPLLVHPPPKPAPAGWSTSTQPVACCGSAPMPVL